MSKRVNQLPKAKTVGLVAERRPEQTLVYDSAHGEVHCLNRVAALVWDACDGRTPVREIRDRLARESDVSLDDVAVWHALDELGAKGLIEAPVRQPGDQLTRRSLLLGMGALAAITTLVIPGSSAVQSDSTWPPTTSDPSKASFSTTPPFTTAPPTTQGPTCTTTTRTTPPPTTQPPIPVQCRRPFE